MNIQLHDIREDIATAVRLALQEDIGTGDITAELIPADAQAKARIITREPCVVCGTAWLDEVFAQLGGLDMLHWQVSDGDALAANDCLVTLKGNARTLLTGERTALNFLQLLSGTATLSRAYAQQVKGTDIKILDTRKTLPGLRTAQKYAVAVGGCHNHRVGLYDAFLIKENHIHACGGITQAVARARELHPDKPIIVEVENIAELKEAEQCQVTRIMLDNFSEQDFKELASLGIRTPLEASGNITEASIDKLKQSGVAAISSGSLTKHVKAVDLSMRFEA